MQNYLCTLIKTGPKEEYSMSWWQMKILSFVIITLMNFLSNDWHLFQPQAK